MGTFSQTYNYAVFCTYRISLNTIDLHIVFYYVQIYFLPLPLYVEEERSIYIIANHQHRKTKLSFSKFMVSGDYDSGCISCEFPKGVEIQPEIDNFTIPVTVKFRSTKAVSAIVLVGINKFYWIIRKKVFDAHSHDFLLLYYCYYSTKFSLTNCLVSSKRLSLPSH